MKKLIFSTILTLSILSTFAQNTFPTSGNVGVGTTSPPYSLSLTSATIGIAQYNTVDMSTNLERFRQFWNANNFVSSPEIG